MVTLFEESLSAKETITSKTKKKNPHKKQESCLFTTYKIPTGKKLDGYLGSVGD